MKARACERCLQDVSKGPGLWAWQGRDVMGLREFWFGRACGICEFPCSQTAESGPGGTG